MRRPSYGLLVLVWVGLGSGCRIAPPTPEDVLAVGFRTPEQTFRTFQTALRGDLADLEYRCLSAGFKEREDVSELGWRVAREKLLSEQPFVRQAARARIQDVALEGPDRARLVAEIDTWFVDARFEVRFVREDAYEIADGEGPLEGAFLPWTRAASVAPDAAGAGKRLLLALPFPEGTELESIAEVEFARRWKIDSFAVLEDPRP